MGYQFYFYLVVEFVLLVTQFEVQMLNSLILSENKKVSVLHTGNWPIKEVPSALRRFSI